jgi:hypothetical protein
MLCLWCGREPVAIASVELPGVGKASWPTCDGHRSIAGREVADALARLVVPGSAARPGDVIDATGRDAERAMTIGEIRAAERVEDA